MKWLKLDTGVMADAKVMSLVAKHGCEGFGLYILTLALIGQGVDADHQDCVLEHTPETLRTFSGLTPERVQDLLTEMVELKLLDYDVEKKQYFNRRLLRRLDEWTSKRIRSNNSGVTPEKLRLKRKEEKRKEENMQTPESQNKLGTLQKLMSQKFTPGFTLEERFPMRSPMVYELYRFLSSRIQIKDPDDEIHLAEELARQYPERTIREIMQYVNAQEYGITSLLDFSVIAETLTTIKKPEDVL